MRISRVGSGYIVLIWLFLVVMIGLVLILGYRRNSADLEQLMATEAGRMVEIAAVSSAAAIHSLDEVEYLTAERLLDNARLVERLSRPNLPHPDTLAAIVSRNDLHMINILDRGGKSVASSMVDAAGVQGDGHNTAVDQVINGQIGETVIGFMEGRYYQGKRYGVVVRRKNGGAVVVNADSDRMLEFRKRVGLGQVFAEIGMREGIGYIALQDTMGILAASRAVSGMSRIDSDSVLADANSQRTRRSRFMPLNNGRYYEVISPLVVDDVYLGLIRIGLVTDTFDQIRSRARLQFIILFFVAVLSGVFVLVYLILRQNFVLLNAEHDRILSDVREMEEQSRRMERLTSMGRLAGGVAHEIRNPLNAVSIITQRLKSEFEPQSDENEYRNLLSTVSSEIARISTIIESFLQYARPPKLQMRMIRFANILEDAAAVARPRADKINIDIEIVADSRIMCRCDPDQMKQALLNILLNALDAIGQNGAVTMRANRHRKAITLEISDTGPGISQDTLPKVFDPYFTTKQRGNGLGLSEVHRIVTAHGGKISVTNADGALFTIMIPREGGE